jgi:hypothetical protein
MMKKLILLLILIFSVSVFSLELKPPKGNLANKTHPYSRGLVGYWLQNEAGGTLINDLSGNGHSGTINGAVWNTFYRGSCLLFDGTDDDVQIPFTTDITASDFSVVFWIKILTRADYKRLIYLDDQFSIVYTDSGDQLNWNVEPDDVDGEADTLHILGTDTWKYVVFVYNKTAKTGQYYINGEAVDMTNHDPASAGWTNSGETDDILYLMSRGSSSFQHGEMSEVMIYNRALTSGEISYLYSNPYCLFGGDDIALFQSGESMPASSSGSQVIFIN